MHCPSRPSGVADTQAAAIGFSAPDLFEWPESASAEALDALSFGIIAMTPDGTVDHYNAIEGRRSGLMTARFPGRNFFVSVAPCATNALVAHRYLAEPEIDATIDDVFTFRVAPQKVRLRLLKRPGGRRMYLAVADRC